MYKEDAVGNPPYAAEHAVSQATPYPRAAGQLEADVVVVGGGLTGLSAAWHLSQQDGGRRIVLIEASHLGDGASSRAAGNCLDLVGESVEQLVSQFGRDGAIRALAYGRDALAYVDGQADTLQIPYTSPRAEFIEVAVTQPQVAVLERRLALLRDLRFDDGRTWLSTEQCRARFPESPFLGAISSRHAKLCNPRRVVDRWVALLQNTSVRVFEQSPVRQIARRGREFAVTTPEAVVFAPRVVVATNAFTSGEIDGHMSRLQRKMWTYCIATEPLDASTWARVGLDTRTSFYDANHLLHYFRRTDDERLLFGGGLPGIEKSTQSSLASHRAQLQTQLRKYFPALLGARVDLVWCGPISITRDLTPGLGTLHDGRLLVAVGCIGHGLVASQYNGKLLADAIGGVANTFDRFPFRSLKRWPGLGIDELALRAMRSFLRAKDAWNASAS